MRRNVVLLVLALTLVISMVVSACASPTPTPSPGPTPSASPKPTSSPTATQASQSAADYYKGKNLTYVVYDGIGTDQDLVARTVAPTLKELLGAASVIVVNKEEAGGMGAWNQIYESKDGLTFGEFDQGDAFVRTIRKDPAQRFDPMKYTWVGFTYPPEYLFPTVSDKSRYQGLSELQAAKGLKGAVAGAYGDYHLIAIAYAAMFDLDIKVAAGLSGGNRVVALQNKTIDLSVFANDYFSRYTDLIPLAVSATKHSPDVPDAPTLLEIMPANVSDDVKALVKFCSTTLLTGHAYVTSPGLAPDRAAYFGQTLRKAFEAHHAEVEKFMEMTYQESDLVPPEEAYATFKGNLESGAHLGEIMDQMFEKYKA